MFRGTFTALVTPMRDGELDEDAFRAFVDWQIAEGVHGLVPVGTTGESPTLSHEEHRRVVELCVEAADGRVPVVAGAGSNNTREAIDLSKHAQAAGASAILSVTPYYNKPSQAGMTAHFSAINDAVDIPVIIYNIPGRSIVDMSVQTMADLAKLPHIAGVKDATSEPDRVTLTRLAAGPDFNQLSGDDGTVLGYMAHGGHGVISVTSNVAPKLCSEFIDACLAGDFARARELDDRLMPLHKALFVEPSPAGAKYALSLLGKMEADVRLPIYPLSGDGQETVRRAMVHAGLIN